MPYDTEPLTVPQPTYSGGSAVQTATDPSGQKWQFDNEGGNWVNLSTGESVSPKVFSQMAGRSDDTAANTMQLADAMRREEASLTAPRVSAPITPPMTGTTPPPMAAPIRAPQGTPIMPPADVARVAAQQPVPSTATPPSPEANKFYIMQLIRRGALTPKDAVLLYPQFFQQPSKPMVAGGRLWNVSGGAATPLTPPTAPKATRPTVTHETGVGIFVTNPDTGETTQTVKFPAKAKYGATTATVNVDTFNVTDVKGDPNNPDFNAWIDKQKAAKAQSAAILAPEKTGPSRLALFLTGGPSRPTVLAPGMAIPPAAPTMPATETRSKSKPAVGTVIKGYRFLGGNPSDKSNWEKVE